MSGHVVICQADSLADGIIPVLEREGVAAVVLEEDPSTATELFVHGAPVVRGAVDDVETYRALQVDQARLVVLNRDDLTNTNIALTVREACPTVRIVALANEEHSVDILELSGCDRVLFLKRQLGEQLANRVRAGHAEAHVIGRYRDLVIAEFSVHQTPLAGRTIAECQLREIAGVNVVGVWMRARMLRPSPELVLEEHSLPVIAGSAEAVERLNEFLYIYDTNRSPVVVLGGGKVGRAATRALKERSIPVHLVERDPNLADRIGDLPDRLVIGDAADRGIMDQVGIADAPSVLISTNDDAANIYLSSYSRRLNPEAQIVSRINRDRNLAAIQRAGADLVLSYTALGIEHLLAILHDRPPLVLGEGVAFHEVPCPPALAGRTLGGSRIGRRTGVTVVGIENEDGVLSDPGPASELRAGHVLLVIGDQEQIAALTRLEG